jgi:thioredoxin
MKKILFALLLALAALTVNAKGERYDDVREDTVYTVHSINQDQFRDLIADWNARDWVMRSPRPVVVDFYADWCLPCRRLEPMLRQIAQHYNGEVDFYRINVDRNSDIADVFQIRSIPFLLVCPMDGEPKSIIGIYPQQEFIRVINQALNL